MPNAQQLCFFVILAAAFALYLTERIRNDFVSVLIILALYLTGILKSTEALAGFSSEPAIIIASIFVLSGALHKTGLSDSIGAWIGRLAGNSCPRALAVMMPTVAAMSAVTHHVTTTAVMLPVALNISRERNIPASKLLMPISFAASLGTTIAIIGAPAFLVANSVLQQAGRPGLRIFSIAPIGLCLTLVGTIFILLIGRFLLPTRTGLQDPISCFRLGGDYLTELTILSDSPFLKKTIVEIETSNRYHFKVVGWMHGSHQLAPPFNGGKLSVNDVLLIHTTAEEMIAIRQESGVELHPIAKYGDKFLKSNGNQEDMADRLVQAVVAPASDLAGRTIGDIAFKRRYGAIVVGLWRRDGKLEQALSKIELHPGDVLVLQGDEDSLARVANDRAFLMMVPFHGEPQQRRKASLAGGIMLATICAAAFNVVSVEMAMLAGAVAVVLTGCLTARQAYQSVDAKIYVFIAGAISLGIGMQKSGAAALLAKGLQNAIGGWHQTLILLVLFGVVAIVTQFMSDAATTALFAPIACSLALALGHPPEPYVVTVAMSSVAAFLTPIGHHGNLLVYGPGRYEFADFFRVGAPLTILVALIVIFIAPLLWPV